MTASLVEPGRVRTDQVGPARLGPAFERFGSSTAFQLVDDLLGIWGDPAADLMTVAAPVERAGGRAWAQAEADRQVRQALHALTVAEPTPEVPETLLAVAALVTRRDH